MRRDNPYRRRLLEQLEAEYDAHGCELVKHIVDEYAPLLGVAPRGVPHVLDAFLAEREEHWSPEGLVVGPEVVRRMALAADGVEAYAIAKEEVIAPPTQRQFFRVPLVPATAP